MPVELLVDHGLHGEGRDLQLYTPPRCLFRYKMHKIELIVCIPSLRDRVCCRYWHGSKMYDLESSMPSVMPFTLIALRTVDDSEDLKTFQQAKIIVFSFHGSIASLLFT